MIGRKLKYLRDIHQKSQLEVCSVLNIEQSTLANYENDKRIPKIDILVKLADYYNVSVDYLLGRETGFNEANRMTDNSKCNLDFHSRVRDLLSEANLSETDFIKIAGLNQGDNNAYLPDNYIPSADNLIKISDTLHVSVDYLLGVTDRKRLSTDEAELLSLFNRCDSECKKYLIAKAGVLCIEGITAVSTSDYGKHADAEKKSLPSSGIEGTGA